MEDYGPLAFNALKALEGVLRTLLLNKNITIGEKDNFGSVFEPEYVGSTKHVLNSKSRAKINEVNYEAGVEEIYNYFKGVRHVNFHVNQILQLTSMIDKRTDADAIVNKVVELIEKVSVHI